MPLYRRLPKRGFLPHGGHAEFALVNVEELAKRFPAGAVVDPDALAKAGVIKRSGRKAVKVLGDGAIGHALTIKTHKISRAAREKVEAAGGRVEVLPL